MANQASSAGPGGSPDYHTVFIDTSLDTHLITVVSSSETFSDLKKKVLHEHALCFPHIGEIKIHGLKVKRRGKFYYLSDSILVKSVFHGVSKSWFVCVDASRLEEFDGDRNFVDPLSNNLLTPLGTMNIASDNEFRAKSPRIHALLTNGDDQKLQKQIDSHDQNLSSKSMKMGVKQMGDNCGEAKRVDGSGESSGPVNEKGDHYEKENGIINTPKEGPESIIEGGIFDKSGSMPLEERAAETTPVVREDNHKPKRKNKRDKSASKELIAEVPEFGMHTSEKVTEEPDNSLANANANANANDGKNAIDEHRTSSAPPGAKEDRGTVEERVTIQSERTGKIEKVVELNNAESRENDPQIEPSAKRKRKRKQENEGGQDLLKDDRTLVFKSNGVMIEHSTVSQKSLVDEQHGGNATLGGLSNGTLEAVHLESASPSKKREKKKKRSAKTSNQEATVVPSAIPNEGVNHFGMPNNSNLGEKTAAVLASGQIVQDAASSEPGVPNEINQKHKHGDTAEETNLRPHHLETGTKNKEVGNLDDEHEASVAAMESKVKRKKVSKDRHAIVSENNSCAESQASDKKEKANDIPRHGNDSRHENHFSGQSDGVEEHQNYASSQNGRVNVVRESALEFSPQMVSSERNKVSALDHLQLKDTETVVGSEPVGATVNVDPPKSSKKRKKSKKANDLVNITPSASVTEHVEAFVSNTSTAPNKEESDKLPKVGKETDTMSTSFLATDKEINDVIQNVVDSVQQMGNDQMCSESILGKSKNRSRKKQKSDANLLPESAKQNENVVPNNTERTEYSSEVTKQAAVASTDSKKHSVGSLMESENNNITEKDQGVQPAHLMPQKLESTSDKRSHEAVVSRANELAGDVEVSCDGSGVNFNDYFTPKKHNPETVGSGEMPVDQTAVKAKKKTEQEA